MLKCHTMMTETTGGGGGCYTPILERVEDEPSQRGYGSLISDPIFFTRKTPRL